MKILAVLASLAVLSLAPAVQAQQSPTPFCGDRAEIFKSLYDKYGEMVSYRALDRGGVMVEWLVNSATESWTMTVTKPRGQTCVIGAGDAWRTLAPEVNGPKA